MANFNLNKVILGGRLTADPELKQTPQGVSVTSFSIAVNRRGKDAQTDFISCVAWRQTADFICRFFKKGSSICISGSVQTRTWNDQQNNKRYATEIVADEAYFVDAKADAPSGSFGADAPAFQTQESARFEEVASDDDLPF
ncbi:MAG: single-stranded DNA-binding protein [Ruminococcaceae bacterium]|nr:single-stranded DNA-binding protein [Oscillospiraceae bacterium]